MPRVRRRDLVARVAELEKALTGHAGVATAGATVVDTVAAQAAITPPSAGGMPALARALTGYVPLPRTAEVFGGALGPGYPITPAPIDPLRADGRADPRLTQYDPARNLNLHDRPVPFATLRRMADQCDLVRRCIEIRKSDITGLRWSFTLADDMIAQIMADRGDLSPARAAAVGRDQFTDQIQALTEFWETPDRIGGYQWADWIGSFLEEHFVLDAVPVYPHPNLGGGLHSLEILDGATIKPLLDHRGTRPLPPEPAYQQILWGFPRGEFQASAEPDDEYAADQLYYAVRNRRAFTPYGLSVVEQSLPAAALWLERQQWLRSEYTDSSVSAAYLTMHEGGEQWTPDQRRMWEESINDEVAGNTARRRRLRLLIPGMDVVESAQIDEKYKQEYDEFLIKRVGSNFGVQPTQLGVIPRTGIGGRGQQKGEQDEAETTSQKPLLEWVVDQVNAISRAYLGMDRAITLRFDGGDSDEDELSQANTAHIVVGFGGETLNDYRAARGLPPYDMPEADEPMVITPTGPVFLTGTLDKQLNPPPPPPNPFGHPGAPPAPGDQPPADDGKTPQQSQEADDSKQAATAAADEARKFVTFAANKQGGVWRDFVFKHLDTSQASALNAAGAAGDLTLVKTLAGSLGKAEARQRPGHRAEAALVDQHKPHITDALRALLDPHDLAARFLAVYTTGKKAQPANPYDEWARSQSVDITALTAAITELHSDAYRLGQHTAARLITDAGGHEVSDELGDIDPSLLASTTVTARGIADTTLAEIGTQLGNAIDNGWTVEQLAAAVDALISDPGRAYVIADTEMCRAVSTATLNTYMINGIARSEWLDTGGACPICQANANAGPVTTGQAFPSGDTAPPAHPRCRCALTPVTEGISS